MIVYCNSKFSALASVLNISLFLTISISAGGARCSCPNGKKECYFPVQRSCNQFMHCSNGTSYTKTCPNDLRWSLVRNKCDWPKAVQCGNRPVTSRTSSTSAQCSCPGVFFFIDQILSKQACILVTISHMHLGRGSIEEDGQIDRWTDRQMNERTKTQ